MTYTTSAFLALLSASFMLSATSCKEQSQQTHTLHATNSTEIDTNALVPFKDYYKSGSIKTKGQLRDNQKTGEWISYYENREQKAINHYKNNVFHGHQKMDYSQELYMEGDSKDGIKVGIWNSYFKDDNRIKYIKAFDDAGNASGEWKSYYDSGELYNVEHYLNNKPHGIQTTYFKNGNVNSSGNMKEGKEEGMWSYYYDDGTLASEKTFVNGEENGPYRQYHTNGNLHKEGSKQNFKNVGTWSIYDTNGDLFETLTYTTETP
ncbi:toxin-antitoxin system YwqK family antitoxin [Formosa sp. 3Alg 14/1]|uniref:toxin-antitoxin system YwqK family antitoxin n=1 Tax=Formosa sp. 3Alg 14/1 TaxID=3382190 RepID=UPI0039BDAE8A